MFSLLSTAGPLSETAFFERIASLFSGHDLPDDGLVRACLDSYRSLASTPERLHHRPTTSCAAARSTRSCWRRSPTPATGSGCASGSGGASRRGGSAAGTARRPARRRASSAPTSAASARPSRSSPRSTASGTSAARSAFLFEVEWTAMLGEPLLRRHARIPPDDGARSASWSSPRSGPSSSATSSRARRSCGPRSRPATGTSSSPIHLRTFLARDPLDLADLEPYLGLDPGDRARRRADGRCSAADAGVGLTAVEALRRTRRQRHPELRAPRPRRAAAGDPSVTLTRIRIYARQRPRRPVLGGDPRAQPDDRDVLRRRPLRRPPRGPAARGPGARCGR